jgi:hypothetical protein
MLARVAKTAKTEPKKPKNGIDAASIQRRSMDESVPSQVSQLSINECEPASQIWPMERFAREEEIVARDRRRSVCIPMSRHRERWAGGILFSYRSPARAASPSKHSNGKGPGFCALRGARVLLMILVCRGIPSLAIYSHILCT